MGLNFFAPNFQRVLHIDVLKQVVLKQAENDNEQVKILHKQNEPRYEKNNGFYGFWRIQALNLFFRFLHFPEKRLPGNNEGRSRLLLQKN